ncbi:hypothetical protein HW45_15455 [Vibrio sp. ER1A]|nr:hypothetical protein HW45_15455 [Vibrio sp. ER1A]
MLHNLQQLNDFTTQTTVQLRGILVDWKATEKKSFLVAKTEWGNFDSDRFVQQAIALLRSLGRESQDRDIKTLGVKIRY